MTDEIEHIAADAPNAECANPVYLEHVAQELARIAERLQAPDPFHHAGLYAAQQALCWAAQPDAFKSPYALVTGIQADAGGCCSDSYPPPLPDTSVETLGES